MQQNGEEFETTCNEALGKIKHHRRKVEEAFDTIEAKLVEQVDEIKSKEMKKLAAISNKYQTPHEELQAALEKLEALQNSKHYCSLYSEMKRTKNKFESMDVKMKEADVDQSFRKCQVKFSPNKGMLDSLNNSETFGLLSVSDKDTKVTRCKDAIVSTTHDQDIEVKTGTDTTFCWVTGLVILPDGRLIIADCNGNSKIKAMNVQSGQVLTELKMASYPWDIAAINNNTVAVTLPVEKKLAIVIVVDKDLIIDRTLTLSGTCRGVDFRKEKLAVSFCDPHKVQILNLQGTVLYTISHKTNRKVLFNNPLYLAYGQDDTTLYVSNYSSNNVMCVKLDGNVVATYTDSDLNGPLKPVVDTHGNVYLCVRHSHQVHQISKECKKIKVLLTKADGLSLPYYICLNEEDDKLYVGLDSNDMINVYKTVRTAQ